MSAVEVRDRLLGFVEGVAARLPLRRQRENALVYVRGLIEQGGRKSLQPTLFRLEESPARYESVQQFLADSPWDPRLLIRACAERVAPQIGVVAWIVDDTGIVKDGKHSPGVKRQYSGTLGKIGNCQITVSVHAVGERGTLPLGWQLYLPEEWCDGTLCLHEWHEWTATMSIADTIVPWTAEWLAHYEIWLMTGEWYGGGDWPPRRAGTTGLPSVGEAKEPPAQAA